MKTKDQCCNLEQAKRLKELGIEQKSLFKHIFIPKDHPHGYYHESIRNTWVITNNVITVDVKEVYSAFTVAELGVLLPTGYDTMRLTKLAGKIYQWAAYDDSDMPFGEEKYFTTESEARAAMLIYLLENNIIKVEDVNARLNETENLLQD